MTRKLATGDLLLAYTMTPDPDPLQVSRGQQSLSEGSLDIVVANNSGTALYCDRIRFSIPVSDDWNAEHALTTLAASSSITRSVSPSDAWDFELDTTNTDPSLVVFLGTPRLGTPVLVSVLLFQINDIQINTAPGSVDLIIEERSGTDANGVAWHKGALTFAKFPYGFFVEDFHPDSPQIASGSPVTLLWEGSDQTKYEIFWNGAWNVVDDDTFLWKTPAGLTDTTAFILRASAQVDGETAEHYLSTTVTVTGPTVEAGVLNVTGATTLTGDATINEATFNGKVFTNGGFESNGAYMRGITGIDQLDCSAASFKGTTTVEDGVTLEVKDTAQVHNLVADGATVAGVMTMTHNGIGFNTTTPYGAIEVVDASTSSGVKLRIGAQNMSYASTIAGTSSITLNTEQTIIFRHAPYNDPGDFNDMVSIDVQTFQNGISGMYQVNAGKGNAFRRIAKMGNYPDPSTGYGYGYIGVSSLREFDADLGKMYVDPADNEAYVVTDNYLSIINIPGRDDVEIWYRGLSGPAALAVLHGVAQLVEGAATVELPDHFAIVAEGGEVVVHLTPESADSLGLAVVEKSLRGFTVRELAGGRGSYSFSWMASAPKKTKSQREVVRPKSRRNG